MNDNQKVKICFVSLSSYSLLKGWDLKFAGGAEVQQVELAKQLSKEGYEISFVTYSEKNVIEQIDGIKIIPSYDRNKTKNISFLQKGLSIWKRLKEADADIYFYRSGSPGIVALFCRLNQKKNLNSIASNAEVSGEILIKKHMFINFLLKILNWIDIKFSDQIISQNNFQKSQLKNRFNADSIIIKNAFDLSLQKKNLKDPIYILWIGSIYSVKQPELFLKITRYFPENKFIMIGGYEGLELYDKIKKLAENIPNLEFKGFLSRDDIYEYCKKAILLVNTSRTEGFPNVFLEAWMYFTPVISLNVDPDGVISRYKLGYHSKIFNQMIEDIKFLLEHKDVRETMGRNARKYVESEHDIYKIVTKYVEILNRLT